MADDCRYYNPRKRICDVTKHGCFKHDGAGWRDCLAFLAMQHNAEQLTKRGKEACKHE